MVYPRVHHEKFFGSKNLVTVPREMDWTVILGAINQSPNFFSLGTRTCCMMSLNSNDSDKMDLKGMAAIHPDYHTPTRDCRQIWVPGTHFTKAFYITIPIRFPFHWESIPGYGISTNFVHNMTAPLLCFMLNIVVRERSLIDQQVYCFLLVCCSNPVLNCYCLIHAFPQLVLNVLIS